MGDKDGGGGYPVRLPETHAGGVARGIRGRGRLREHTGEGYRRLDEEDIELGPCRNRRPIFVVDGPFSRRGVVPDANLVRVSDGGRSSPKVVVLLHDQMDRWI